MRRVMSAVVVFGALAGCASSGTDQSLARVHAAEARADQAILVYEMARDTCDPGMPCQATVEKLRQRGLAAVRDVDRAQRDLDYADAAADRRAARNAAASSALIGLSGQMLAPPPRAVTCTTSNTTIPTTFCQ